MPFAMKPFNATEIFEHAESMTSREAVELFKTHMSSEITKDNLVEMGLYAQRNPDYRKQVELVPELSKGIKDALTVGSSMPVADWREAKDIAGAGTNSGRVYLPKSFTDYAGRIVMVTDTHIVQQASKNAVVAHDISRLENGAEITKLNASGDLQGKVIKISYGLMDGKSEVLTFSQVRAGEILKDAQAYAEQAIKTPQARLVFLKHIEAMNAEKIAQSRAPSNPRQQPVKTQQREQERSR
ncbi:KfrB domain-containing protein [Delftia sp. GW456-R20]|uniref:KfrB domain-containing protein n=1 Tax=Delftia sp. GW456-R20 TaxID=1827145 RepID=UPI000ACA1EAD|nr:hypothetical protein [Delftia sp. GW456-R20]